MALKRLYVYRVYMFIYMFIEFYIELVVVRRSHEA